MTTPETLVLPLNLTLDSAQVGALAAILAPAVATLLMVPAQPQPTPQPTQPQPAPVTGSDAPTAVVATAQPYTAMVAFTAGPVPAGKTLKGFTAVSTTQGWIQGSAPASPILVSGGNPGWGGSPNEFTVVANYTDGTSGAVSAPSNGVTPTGGTGNATSPNILMDGVFYGMGDYAYGQNSVQYGNADGGITFNSASQGGNQWWFPNSSYDVSEYTTLNLDLAGPEGESWVIFVEQAGDGGLPGEPAAGYVIEQPAGTQPNTYFTAQVPLKALNIGKGTPNGTIYKVQCHGTLSGSVTEKRKQIYFS